ncbi:hypothetical protein FQR65_LT06733 [Abscondita terminalis]|nr:hypothetical protein FQR65_LT06733 [Abscondita terminalis]
MKWENLRAGELKKLKKENGASLVSQADAPNSDEDFCLKVSDEDYEEKNDHEDINDGNVNSSSEEATPRNRQYLGERKDLYQIRLSLQKIITPGASQLGKYVNATENEMRRVVVILIIMGITTSLLGTTNQDQLSPPFDKNRSLRNNLHIMDVHKDRDKKDK